MNVYKTYISKILAEILGENQDKIQSMLSKPKTSEHGDIAFPTFAFAKGNKEFAAELAKKIDPDDTIAKVSAIGPFLNFHIHILTLTNDILTNTITITKQEAQTYVLDYSAPNIAKPFGIGHLRSTAIGSSVKKLLEEVGHKVTGLNYIGDWGTQFGKVICAYKKWGNETELNADPVPYLLSLYVRFHEEETEELTQEARLIFSELENGNEEYLKLWTHFRELSLDNFQKTYDKMNVSFDLTRGEAYYNDKMDVVVQQLRDKKLLVESQGAQIIDFESHKIALPPIILLKSNGASTYALRDITSAIDRVENLGAQTLLYEVGVEQKLHFQQLFTALKLLGHEYNVVHIDHGMYRFGEQKMSTRKGNIVLMEDILDESVSRVQKIIQEKNVTLASSDKFEQTSQDIGIGAVIFFDLKHDRIRNISFEWEKVLDFQGETGPYVQYTHARICTILKKEKPHNSPYQLGIDERELLLHLHQFDEIIQNSAKQYKPHILCHYLLELCQLFNEYYQNNTILHDDEQIKFARLRLIGQIQLTIQKGLNLLGINAPNEM